MEIRIYLVIAALISCSPIGCSEDTRNPLDSTAESTTPAAFNATDAPTVAFSVPDMMCPEGCGTKTKEILSEQPGAKEVVVDFDAKTATVAIEPGKFDAEAAVAALVDHGFDHSTIKSGEDAQAKSATDEKPAG